MTVAAMVRNEASRYLPSALEAWGSFASRIVMLDDGSDDGSAELAEAAGAEVLRAERDSALGWGEEWRKRSALWDVAAADTDWVFVLDADMVPAADPEPLWSSPADAIAFRLYDLWGHDVYREDAMWAAHRWPRVWAMRPSAMRGEAAKWPQRNVHCGHFPSNIHASLTMLAPPEMSILHYGYADARDRRSKQEQYCSIGRDLTPTEQIHAESIGAEARCLPIPFKPKLRLTRAS